MACRDDEAALRARILGLAPRVTQLAQDQRDLMARTSLLRAQRIAVRQMTRAGAVTVDTPPPTCGAGPVGFHVAGPRGGPFATLRFDVEVIDIGSSDTCNIRADDGSMAPLHAVVKGSERGAELTGMGSAGKAPRARASRKGVGSRDLTHGLGYGFVGRSAAQASSGPNRCLAPHHEPGRFFRR